MHGLIERALSNPWQALDRVLDGPLHPGGAAHTRGLLDRADVGDGTLLLDAGCGAGHTPALARERGAEDVGVDHEPPAGEIRADVSALPVRDGGVDVVLAECVLCLVHDRSRAIEEFGRVVRADGRLALSALVVEGQVPDRPDPVAGVLRLSDAPSRDGLVADVERAGFDVRAVRDRPEDLLAMRDRVAARVDYEALLGLLGERGDELQAAIDDLESAVETGRLGYVSLVATPDR